MAKRAETGNGVAAVEVARTFSTVSIAALVPKVTRPAFKKRSPNGALLMADWAMVVGPEMAAQTMPERLSGTTLTLACSGPVAMELSHQTGALMARINAYAGQRLVETIKFVQSGRGRPAAARLVRVGAVAAIADFPAGEVHDALARVAAALKADGRG